MKKLLFLLFACGLMGISSYAQVANYTFSQATSTYTEITGGTVLGDTTIDEQFFVDPAVPLGGVTPTGPGLPIGFTFVYNGIPYNVFGVNTNAWISFGQDTIATNHVNLTSTTYTTPISTASTAPAKLQDRISPFGRNIAAQLGSELSYLTSGAAPNRTLTIQWKHFRRNTQRGEDFNFQIVLHETTNVIEFIYGAVTVNASNATSPQIGLRGSVATDFNNRSTTTDWSATTAGTLNTSSVAISLTVYPTPGLIYRWTPPLALDAGVTIINSPSTATSSAVSGLNKIAVTVKNFGTSTLTSATVDWTVNGAAQTPYSWTGSLTLNQTSGPDTIGAYTFTTPGIYTIKAWTTAPNGGTDLNNSNDTMTKVVYVAGYASLPFSEDFDHAWILSTSEVPSIYWTNSPNTGNSSWRRDDQGVSAALWTNNNGTYAPTGTGSGTLHSARFHAVGAGTTPGIFDANLNFSTAGTKMLKFFYVNTATANDSLVVSVSFNNGTTFKRLNKYTTNTSWTQYTLNLGDSTNTQTIIKFEGYSLTGMGAPTIDFGIDSIQVYLLPANDMAAVSFLAPVSGCASANDSVMVKIANVGTASQSNIPVYYSINGTVIGPETVTGPVASGDTVIYKFTHLANLSAGGPYIFKAWVKLATDVNHSNDSVFANVNAIGIIHTFPFVEDFNSTQYYFTETTAANAGAAFYSNGGVGGTGCAFTTGASAATGWMNGVTSAAIAYSYTTHLASLAPCSVDATGLTKLRMSFDLKQTYSSQQTYTWLCAIANGTDTLMDVNGIKYYNPTTASSDPFTTRIFDLSALAGTSFTIKLESACKYDSAHSAPGNNNYIDNIKFWEPVLIDAGVTAVLSPVTKACGVAHDTIKAIVENFGLDTLTKIPVVAKVTTPTGAHAFFYDTIAGPLAPNASTTIAIGNGSTVLASILPYFIKAYTSMAGDTVHTNDTTIYSFYTYTKLPIPHLENFVSTTYNYWNDVNFRTGSGHGNTYPVMYDSVSNSKNTGSAHMDRKTGTVTSLSYLSFDYRIVTYPAGTTGFNLAAADSIFVVLSDDCGTTYDTLYVIDRATHPTPTASYKTVTIPISSYVGSNVIPGFYVKGATGVGTTPRFYIDIDSVAITDAPNVNLGNDTAFCPGGNVTLNASTGLVSGYLYSYNWKTKKHPASIATTAAITVDSAATYIAVVDNGFGVTASDTIVVSIYPVPFDSLSLYDTSCVQLTLKPGTGFSSYLWSTGLTTPTINVTSSGKYWVEITNSHGCMATDTAHVTIVPLATATVTPQSVCDLDTLQVANAIAANYNSLSWITEGDGHFTTSSTILHPKYKLGTTDISSGKVKLVLTVYSRCDTISDTMVVTITTIPTASAGSNQQICPGTTATLTASGGTTYHWNTGPNTQSITVTPTVATTYTVTATGSCGAASASVTVSLYSDPAVNIAASVNPICKGASTTLTASGASTYLWTGGLTINPRTVSPASTTTYTVTGTYTDGCTATKSKVVTVDSITAPNLGNDTSLCANFTINLNAGTGYSTYLWSTGANASSINVDSSTAHTGIGTIKVYVHVTNGACAITSDTINITFTVCSGVVEYSKNTSISVFPNPTTGMINIVVNGIEGIAVMNIYSLQGQEVLNKELIGNVKTELDLSTLAKGVYFIRITNEKANILSKLIIQ